MKTTDLTGQLSDIDSLLNDFNRELSDYVSSLEFAGEEFEQVEERLNQLNHLKSKYGKTLEAVLEYGQRRRSAWRPCRTTTPIWRVWKSRLRKKSGSWRVSVRRRASSGNAMPKCSAQKFGGI